MKHHILPIAAVTATVVSLPVNLPAVDAGSAGPGALLMTLAVALLWLGVALLCADRPGPLTAMVACLTFFMGVLGALLAIDRLGLCPPWAEAALSVALMVAAAPFYGFSAIAPDMPQALAIGAVFCLTVMVLAGLLRRKARHLPEEQALFGPEAPLGGQPQPPAIDPGRFRQVGGRR